VDALGLKEGDEIEIVVAGEGGSRSRETASVPTR
jgi:hypothetical protein